jgi:hypothetical protein
MSTTPAAHRASAALVFSIAAPVIYLICEWKNWPLFTYHPGPIAFDWFYARAMRDMGPAMYWYGWTANAILGGSLVSLLAEALPPRWTQRIPLALIWLLPTLALPWLVVSLNYYWAK